MSQELKIPSPPVSEVQADSQKPAENQIRPNGTKSLGFIVAMASTLAACGGGGDSTDVPPVAGPAPVAGPTPPAVGNPPAVPPPVNPPPTVGNPPAVPPPVNPPGAAGFQFKSASTDFEAAAFLQQAQIGSSKSDIASVRAAPYATWLDQQMSTPLSEKAWDWLDSRGYYTPDNRINFTFSFFNATGPMDYVVWKQLMSAPDGMRRRMALALSELFVTSTSGASVTWNMYAFAHWWDMLNLQAFGNFRDLLEAVTLHPLMGSFLNTKGNKKENTSGRVPDENYSREVMQLFTIGLYKLNPDGTEVKDATGKLVESYTQDDVTNLARVFTGYDHDYSDGVKFTVTRNDNTTFTVVSRDYLTKPMLFKAADHSALEAKFLGTTIAANTDGAVAMREALNTLFNHPNVGPFFAKQMIQRLVTSNPSPAYVGRVAAAFNNTNNVRGDLRAVWKAILLDDEARNPQNATSTTFGKLREPMIRVAHWAKTFGVRSIAGGWKFGDTSSVTTRIGQSPLRAPSVFNFYRPGFIPPNTALATTKSVAPEFQIVSETTVASYLNWMQSLIRDGVSVREPAKPEAVGTGTLVPDIVASYTDELALVTDAPALVNQVNLVLCAGRLTKTNSDLIIAALNATPVTAASSDAVKLDRVAAAVLLSMASTDYLVQR